MFQTPNTYQNPGTSWNKHMGDRKCLRTQEGSHWNNWNDWNSNIRRELLESGVYNIANSGAAAEAMAAPV